MDCWVGQLFLSQVLFQSIYTGEKAGLLPGSIFSIGTCNCWVAERGRDSGFQDGGRERGQGVHGQHCHVPNHEFQVLQGCGLSCVSKTFCLLTPWGGQGGRWPTFQQLGGWRAALGCSCSRTLFLACLFLHTRGPCKAG